MKNYPNICEITENYLEKVPKIREKTKLFFGVLGVAAHKLCWVEHRQTLALRCLHFEFVPYHMLVDIWLFQSYKSKNAWKMLNK